MSAAPMPTSKRPALPIIIGGAARRRAGWRRRSAEHDVRGERAIAVAQAVIAMLVLLMHSIGLHEIPSLQGLGPLALGALVVSSAVRWALTTDDRAAGARLGALNVLDVGLLVSLIWSYQFAYRTTRRAGHQAAGLRILLLVVGVRALRFHPRPIVITGIAAVVGWAVLLAVAAMSDGTSIITHDYRRFLTSLHILPPPRSCALSLSPASSSSWRDRHLHGAPRRSAAPRMSTDYGEALGSGAIHLEQSVHAREAGRKRAGGA